MDALFASLQHRAFRGECRLSGGVVVCGCIIHHQIMFSRIQTRSFRCLKSVDQTLGPFRALVGPNASGKTTFLDVIGFLGDLERNRGDVLETVRLRSSSFEKLLWMGLGNSFQLAVEAKILEAEHKVMAEDKQRFTHVRYEVEVGLEPQSNEIGLRNPLAQRVGSREPTSAARLVSRPAAGESQPYQ